jgi:hypothetical protein
MLVHEDDGSYQFCIPASISTVAPKIHTRRVWQDVAIYER